METLDLSIQHAYNIHNNKVEYSEILVRKYKNISGAFNIINYVKENNETVEFDLKIMEKILRYIDDKGSIHFPVAINLCSETICTKDLYKKIIELINTYQMAYNNIALEIHEDTDLTNENAVENIAELHKYGVLIALDDFGISKSNLGNIIGFNFDIVKLDKIFADHLGDNLVSGKNKSETILKCIKILSEDLDIKIIVEGIEDLNQLEVIKKLGFKYVQGYVLERPIPIKF